MSTVLSVRVRKELKEKAEQLGIDIREVVEKALEEAIKEKEKEEIKELAMKIKELMKDVSEEEWVEAIREERNKR
ncbi:type II toxin-antitoxin system CcdA family antitoxin [Acidianus sp. HS-5]|uniref:type II toxin-antitoxin system CcdA family antitoxin n=1 Tax=Acidianus sp. HS-5 TaxID=2886040 RepID=UPI001F420C92|nr:type II toxin-antitoxin system CcdA family antitoxin [Acidianus sp. HS-5]BDC17483.1 VapB-type antitoxin [Acidianus sp. HS-5]